MRKPSIRSSFKIPRNILAAMAILIIGVQLSACYKVHNSEHLNYAAKAGLTPITTLSPESAYVVFLRPVLPFYTATVLDGDKFLTMLTNNTHFVYKTTPGTHHFMGYVTRFGPSFIDAELEGGKIYFAAVLIQEGTFKSWLQLLPVVPGDEYWPLLSEWLPTSKSVQPNSSGINWFGSNKSELLQASSSRNQDSRIRVIRKSDGVDRIP